MLDHIGFTVANYSKSREFYVKALATLGYGIDMEFQMGEGSHAGFGTPGKPAFWISSAGNALQNRLHVAFAAKSRAEVDAFYHAAIAAGGKDNGPPGQRPHYHPNYYGAFVIDPDGHNVEAVCHAP